MESQGSLKSLISSSSVLLGFRIFLGALVGPEYLDTTRALKETGLLSWVAKLDRWGVREVEAASFLCRAGKSRQP